jgi:ATP-dependent RNA helicase HrpB
VGRNGYRFPGNIRLQTGIVLQLAPANRYHHWRMLQLPIRDLEQEILAKLVASRRLILQAPTGSGKSTQVPQMLLRDGLLRDGQVVILQPRRLAARLLAARVAFELDSPPGGKVGYQVRFENATSSATRIKYETEGILLRQMLQNPTVEGIQALIFDEFHERHLYGDITLARALEIQETSRPDLLIIVMSATLDTGALEKYLRPCAVLTSEGRTFPVTVEYLHQRSSRESPPVWDLAAEAFAKFAPAVDGDVLVFMPGGYEIHRTIEAIRHKSESRGYVLLPLHGELSPRDQDAAVARYDQPKVVVATNVAETSITIEGVRLVIDSGLARIPRFDPNRGINTLLIEKISRSSADQRAGRAGRTAPGACVRLWSQTEHAGRPEQELPEVKRLDLAEVALTLIAAGVQDLRNFRWLEPPAENALKHAEELLLDLGAIRHTPSAITDLGRRMLAFPVHPRYSRMLLAAQEYGCVYDACMIAALTQGRDLLLRNTNKDMASARENVFGTEATSDFWILMRAWEYASQHQFRSDDLRQLGIHAVTARQVGPLLDQFLRIARDEGLDTHPREFEDEALRKCILIGFSDRVGRRKDDGTFRCELVHGRRGTLAKDSVARTHLLFVAAEIHEIGGPGNVNTLVSLITAIEPGWLPDLFPNDVVSEQRVEFDSGTRRVVAADILRFRDLILSEDRKDAPPAGAAARLLADEIVSGRLALAEWDHHVEQWILRLNLLAGWCPDLHLPPIRSEDRRHIIEQVCLGAGSHRDLKGRDVKTAVQSWLSAPQRALVDKYVPERVTLSNGRTPKVIYAEGAPPHISLRIQELFDVTATPRIAMGRVPVSIHILAPSMRPVQVTQDLESFWREHYPRIKAELQRKYPKHLWR